MAFGEIAVHDEITGYFNTGIVVIYFLDSLKSL